MFSCAVATSQANLLIFRWFCDDVIGIFLPKFRNDLSQSISSAHLRTCLLALARTISNQLSLRFLGNLVGSDLRIQKERELSLCPSVS